MNKHKISIYFLSFVFFFSISLSLPKSGHCDLKNSEIINVSIVEDPAGKMISSGFLGTNILYWIDDKEAWLTKGVGKRLKELHIKTLRYPGGEVADNYDWETNSIERKNKFPYGANTEAERRDRLDFLTFLANAKNIGVENIFFVVNVEGAFFQPGDTTANIEKYADKAARWVKAVRQAGYTVRYWEIGNESYIRSAYGLTASEYASVLKVFYKKMKAADPSILIGAIGPWSSDTIGFADRLGSVGLTRMRDRISSGKEPCKKVNLKKCLKELDLPRGISSGQPWWKVILANGKDSFDYAIIHRYRSDRLKNKNLSGPLDLRMKIKQLKENIEAGKEKKINLMLTEWNTPGKSYMKMTEQEHLVDIAEQLGHYIEGGVDMALYWPWRTEGKRFAVMSMNNDHVNAIYSLFELFQQNYREQLLITDYNNKKGIYVLSTGDKKGRAAMLVNYSHSKKTVNLNYGNTVTSGSFNKEVIVSTGTGSTRENSPSQLLPKDQPAVLINLPPLSVTGVQFNFN